LEFLDRLWNTTPVASQPPLLEEEGIPPRLLRNHPSSKRRGYHPGASRHPSSERRGNRVLHS